MRDEWSDSPFDAKRLGDGPPHGAEPERLRERRSSAGSLAIMAMLTLTAALLTALGINLATTAAPAPEVATITEPSRVIPVPAQPPGQTLGRRDNAKGSAYTLPPVAAPALSPEPSAIVAADERNNVEIYANVNKSVVNITTAAVVPGLFGDDVTEGSGSGFVIDRSGYILTNHHVIERAEAIQVTLSDGTTLPAEVIGQDPPTDVAVLRVKTSPEKLTPLSLGDSANLQVGMKVLVVGNPFGLDRTLTTGVVSSLDRSLKGREDGRPLKGLIQTDAAINPGNSGGPVLNSRGQVIGMSTAIYSRVGQSSGIGFAVPINSIKRILSALITQGKVVRADLGIVQVAVTEVGLRVYRIVEEGPADLAGIRPVRIVTERVSPYTIRRRLDTASADIIVAIDGKKVRSVDDLLTAVEEHEPGERITVTVLREGELVDLLVILGAS